MPIEWKGDEFSARVRRAAIRAAIGIGEVVAVQGKQNAHVLTGTLRRSIHTAPADYMGLDDQERASASADGGNEEDLQDSDPATPDSVEQGMSDETDKNIFALLQVGSWVDYACVEETGRGHKFMEPAVEYARSIAPEIIKQAVDEEGLGRD